MSTCTCGGEIGPRKEESDYVAQHQIATVWVDMTHLVRKSDAQERIESAMGRFPELSYRIVRRNDVVVREFGKGER